MFHIYQNTGYDVSTWIMKGLTTRDVLIKFFWTQSQVELFNTASAVSADAESDMILVFTIMKQ